MTEQKQKNRWKTIAIIFIILFLLETSFWVWAFWYDAKETALTNECYYDICEDYPDAWYDDKICSCYDYDVIGELIVVKQEYMK